MPRKLTVPAIRVEPTPPPEILKTDVIDRIDELLAELDSEPHH
jgi:hypothetical protein